MSTPKTLAHAVITTATLAPLPELDAAGRAALAEAFDVLDRFSGAAVGLAFIEWQRRPIRHDPRPAPVRVDREVSTPPLTRVSAPFRTRSL